VISYNETGFASGLRTALIIMLFIGGGFVAILSVAAFFGETWWFFDYVANYRWAMMWFLIAATILYTLVARGIATFVFLAAALLNAWLIVPLWLGDQPAATGEDGIRIVNANVYPTVSDRDFVIRWMLDSDADLILVAGTTADRMERLTDESSPYRIIAQPDVAGDAGIVVLGTEDWPVEVMRTETYAEPVYRITVGANGATINVVTTWGEMGSNGQKAELLAARLETISAAVATSPHPVTVIGDIGATRWTQGMQTMRDTVGVRDATVGSGYLATSPVVNIPLIGGWIGLPIDVVLMTDDITPLELSTGPDIGSGHLPVTVLVGPGYQATE
jgi:endonuclease/exonuclease/phosphatase (EEP) superfamily protein YafD